MKRQEKFIWFRITAITFGSIIAIAVYLSIDSAIKSNKSGLNLNRAAWEATYTERNLSIPTSGPREGYWGSRLGSKVPHQQLGWHEPSRTIESLLHIDENGQQHFTPSVASNHRILIIGGSVAFGAYASSISTTYFHQLGTELEQRGTPANITVFASAAWKSIQDLSAFQIAGPEHTPTLTVFLNGLNDLTNGARYNTLYDERVPTPDGVEYSVLYHEHDYSARVAHYLENMTRAAEIAANRTKILIALQPSLAERKNLTNTDQKLLQGSLQAHRSRDDFVASYAAIREGLARISNADDVYFVDCSKIFHDEKHTTFTDLWHFSNRGHHLLAIQLADAIEPILKESTPPSPGSQNSKNKPNNL